MISRFTLPVFLLAALLPAPRPASAELQPAQPAAIRARAEAPAGENTPRGAMNAYLSLARRGDYAAAARFLDLSPLVDPEELERGPQLARKLQIVLDRTLWVDLEALSDRPEGLEDDGLPPERDRIATIGTRSGPADLYLARVSGPGGTEVWRIASSTVRRIPELYAQHGFPRFVDRLPRQLVDLRLLDTDLWQWLGLAVLLLVAWALAFSVAWIVRHAGLFLVRRTETDLDDRIADAIHRPLRLAVTIYLFLAESYWLRLAVPVQDFLVRGTRAIAVVIATWMCLRIADLLARATQERMLREDRRSAVSMVNLGRRAVKVLIVALGVLGLLQNLGFNVTGVVAGLGIGGLAVALAAQKTLENVFGGVVLTTDRPIRVGDFCKFGDKMGTVEDVGLRSTRVRTLERTIVTVPNAELASIEIENFTFRDRFRLHTVLAVRYETAPGQLRTLVAGIREALAAHPKVIPEPLRVRFVGFGPSSLDIELFTYIATQDVEEFYAIREELFLRIVDLLAEAGTGFAFPSQTLYLGRDHGIDPPAGLPKR